MDLSLVAQARPIEGLCVLLDQRNVNATTRQLEGGSRARKSGAEDGDSRRSVFQHRAKK